MTQISNRVATPHRIVGLQRNVRVGDLRGNAKLYHDALEQLPKLAPTVVLGPEMGLAGYPVQDMVLIPGFVEECWRVLQTDIVPFVPENIAMLVGLPVHDEGKLYNAIAWVSGGRVLHVFKKHKRPNDSVFDEVRTFASGEPSVFTWKGITYGVPLCEDIWWPEVCKAMQKMGAQILLVPNGSPYDHGKFDRRWEKCLKPRVMETGLPLLYINRWGGQDELVFDGGSVLVLPNLTTYRARMYGDAAISFSFDGVKVDNVRVKHAYEQLTKEEECRQHLVAGLRDYVGRHGAGKAVFGSSGGIDSALVNCLAVDALGPENVTAITMPSKFSSGGSQTDSEALARALKVNFMTIPIEETVNAFRGALKQAGHIPTGVADENLQPRTRGTLLMALSNMGLGMVLSTGNKSEMSVGYATLYGDMNGGFNPIKDLYKMEVFALAKYYVSLYRQQGNHAAADALQRIIDKPPSAELREGQKDEDSLPPYPVLDAILRRFIEERLDPHEARKVLPSDISDADIMRVWKLLANAEFKRRQACPGIRWHQCDLDKDWRMPLNNAWPLSVSL